MRVFVEADAPRVSLRRARRGGRACAVGAARRRAHAAPSTRPSPGWRRSARRRAVTELMRIAWRTVGAIITRVWADVDALGDRLDGLTPDRHRRDLLQARPPLPDRRRRPRQRPAGVGRARPGPGHAADASSTLLGPERCAADHPRVGRRGRLDRRDRRRTLPERGAVRRPVPRRRVGHRRPRRGPPPSLERGPPRRPDPRQGLPQPRRHRRCPPIQDTPATRCGRTPRTSPTGSGTSWPGSPRPTPGCTAPTCSKKACATCSRVKGEAGKTALDRWLSWARRCRIPAFVHLARRITAHPRQDPRRARPRPVQRADRIDQHQDPTPHPHRLRLPLSPDALIALAMLSLGGHRPVLPGRPDPRISQ